MSSLTIDLDPADDFPHRPELVPLWSENYQWQWIDSTGLGVAVHVGTMPADPELWHSVVAIVLPDGHVYSGKSIGLAPGPASGGTSMNHVEVVEPYQRFTYRFNGGVQRIDEEAAATGLVPDGQHVGARVLLEVWQTGAVWSAPHDDEQPEWGSFHHEQPLRARGTVILDGVEFKFDGIGYRDHTVGLRDLSQIRRAFWCNGVFESGWAFGTLFAERVSGETAALGFIFRDGAVAPVTFHGPTHLEDAFGSPRQFDIGLGDLVINVRVGQGMKYSWVGPSEWALGTAAHDPDGYVVHHHLTTLECEGERGYGLADRGAKISVLFHAERGVGR